MRFGISPQRRGFRLTLFVLASAAVCLVLGAKTVTRSIRQSTAVSMVSRTGGVPSYRFFVPVPPWCVDRFGPDLFGAVVSVTYFEHGAHPAYEPQNHRNYSALCDLPQIEKISIFDSEFPTDVLENMTSLRCLAIDQNGLRDDDMDAIAKLHSLQTLSLSLNDITDSGAKKLSRLHGLTELDLSGNFVSDQGIDELQLFLPNCRIQNRWSRAESQE